ncbi:TolC family protein [Granulicella cerasi]|uniref:TolC family protein n=1 Tax=Granulicella cerasi TaxID=741063 RepID=A0ABW1ZC00_9BACT|nr:TolC family protein [Granulicella cerasi]
MRRALLLTPSFAFTLFAWAQAPAPAPQQNAALPATIIAAVHRGSATPLTLQQVLDQSHRANPTLLSGAEHLNAVRAGEVTAGLRQNPVLTGGGQMFTLAPDDPNGPPFYNVGVQRLFERGGKRQLRLDGAKATTTLTSDQLADTQRQMDLAVRQAFAKMLFAEAALEISRENLEGYRHTVDLMKVRLDAGDMDRTDFDRVELQLVGFENDFDNANLALRQSSIALQSMLGVNTPSDDFAVTGSLEPSPLAYTLEELHTAALKNRPDLQAAQAQVDANAASVKLAVANGKADPTLEAEYERSGHANTMGANIQIPLRFFDRNQGEKARAQHELESSRLALVAARNQVISDVDTAWAAYQTATSQDGRYRAKYLAEAAHVRDNMEFSYRHGNTTLLDYLSALSDYRQVNLASLNANLQLLLAVEQLTTAAHMEINP